MNDRRCEECGRAEADAARLIGCHECGRTVCLDDCVAATDHEHGVSWCAACCENSPPTTSHLSGDWPAGEELR